MSNQYFTEKTQDTLLDFINDLSQDKDALWTIGLEDDECGQDHFDTLLAITDTYNSLYLLIMDTTSKEDFTQEARQDMLNLCADLEKLRTNLDPLFKQYFMSTIADMIKIVDMVQVFEDISDLEKEKRKDAIQKHFNAILELTHDNYSGHEAEEFLDMVLDF